MLSDGLAGAGLHRQHGHPAQGGLIPPANVISLAALGLLTLQRIAELPLSRRNAARLKARGGVESGDAHYLQLLAAHVLWMTGLWLIGYWAAPNLPLLAVCAVLQAGRLWVILSLGDRWTTKIIVVPGEPLVTAGPYRFLRHPNYAIVMAEIVVWPLMFGQPLFAAIFALINGAILLVRIRAEERALGEPRS